MKEGWNPVDHQVPQSAVGDPSPRHTMDDRRGRSDTYRFVNVLYYGFAGRGKFGCACIFFERMVSRDAHRAAILYRKLLRSISSFCIRPHDVIDTVVVRYAWNEDRRRLGIHRISRK